MFGEGWQQSDLKAPHSDLTTCKHAACYMTTPDNSVRVSCGRHCVSALHPQRTAIKWVLNLYSCAQCWVAALLSAESLSPKIYWMIALQLPLFNNCIDCFHSFEWNDFFIKKSWTRVVFILFKGVWNKHIMYTSTNVECIFQFELLLGAWYLTFNFSWPSRRYKYMNGLLTI